MENTINTKPIIPFTLPPFSIIKNPINPNKRDNHVVILVLKSKLCANIGVAEISNVAITISYFFFLSKYLAVK